jgi:transposase
MAPKSAKAARFIWQVDTLGNLLGLYVTPANEQDRAQVSELAEQVQEATGDHIQVAFVDAGYTG